MDSWLKDIAVVSPNDGWAIGDAHAPGEGGRGRSVILRWDGSRWRAVRHPQRSGDDLMAISASSPTDVWVVGSSAATRGLVLRWDGIGWRRLEAADPGTRSWNLTDIAAIGPDDVWAVGNVAGPNGRGALIEHWNGEEWSVVQNPASPADGVLNGASLESIAVVAPDDIWAVGEIGGHRPSAPTRGLVERWDGVEWHLFRTPKLPGARPRSGWLFGAAAVSPTDIWAVGSSNPRSGWIGGRGNRQLIEHWAGGRWTIVPAARQGEDGILLGVAASDVFGVWAVGGRRFVGAAAEWWDGSAWTAAAAPAPSFSLLTAIAAAPDGDLWAVGGKGSQRTLAMRCS